LKSLSRIAPAAALLALLAGQPAWARSFELPPPVTLIHALAGTQARSIAWTKAQTNLPYGTPYFEAKEGIFVCLPLQTKRWTSGPVETPVNGAWQALFGGLLSEAGLKSTNGGDSLFEDASIPTDLELGAVVTNSRLELCYPLGPERSNPRGSARIDVEWQVYSRVERKVLARVVTAGGAELKTPMDGAGDWLSRTAIADNIKALLNAPEFRTALTASSGPPSQTTRLGGPPPMTLVARSGPPSVADAAGSVVAIFAGQAFGSGFIIGDGYLLTNHHVVGKATTVRVRWSDGLETSGDVVRSDARRDVALVKVDTRGRPPLGVRRDPIQPSETVFAIGTPLDPGFQGTVTRGIVSANRTYGGFAFIQSDVTVNHGNSGGPLLDEKARLVGITDLGFQPDGVPTGLNLFIPIRDALDFLSLSVSAPTG
jgi:serine protease Do